MFEKLFRKKPESMRVVLQRPGVEVIQDGRWLNIRGRLSLGNGRDRQIISELSDALEDALLISEPDHKPDAAKPAAQPSLSLASPRESDEQT